MTIRLKALGLALCTSLALGGCASLNTYHSEAASYGDWPAARSPGRYAIERLPSQAAGGTQQQAVEDAARRALEAAGFVPADPAETADVRVQVDLRVAPEGPAWWGGPQAWPPPWRMGYGVHGRAVPWIGAGPWWPDWGTPRYSREATLVIRDRVNGAALFEGRARSEGLSRGGSDVAEALFRAALDGFPQAQPEARRVSVVLP